MPQWLRQILDKYFVNTVYSPETRKLGVMNNSGWPALLAELASGYEKHAPIFHAVQIMLRRAEAEAFKVPRFKTSGERDVWNTEQYGLMCEIDALRRVLRLPIEGQKLKEKYAMAKEKSKSKKEEEESDLD